MVVERSVTDILLELKSLCLEVCELLAVDEGIEYHSYLEFEKRRLTRSNHGM